MPDQSTGQVRATELAERLYEWAKAEGALAAGSAQAVSSERGLLHRFAPPLAQRFPYAEGTLKRLKIVAVTADDNAALVGVLVKNQVTDAALKRLPNVINGLTLRYIGHTDIEKAFPQPAPQSTTLGGSRFYQVNGSFACGSSVTAAPVADAETMGALVRLRNGILCGLSDNHVTGNCNFTPTGMWILCPAPLDADPSLPPPTAIGRHHAFTLLRSRDPGQVARQELDAAIFRIENELLVTSWQGTSAYDTPSITAAMAANMRVKKIGRTTGETTGRVIGPVVTPLQIPYQSAHFRALVHFTGIWAVANPTGNTFSEPGDSGSLVVTEDGAQAVGLLLGGSGPVSMVMPIDSVLAAFDGATLVDKHNL